jgi:hypothetical protein
VGFRIVLLTDSQYLIVRAENQRWFAGLGRRLLELENGTHLCAEIKKGRAIISASYDISLIISIHVSDFVQRQGFITQSYQILLCPMVV